MKVPEPAAGYLVRIDEVAERLQALAEFPAAAGALTSPDEPSGERWDQGQAWAHLAEFVPFWVEQIEIILDTPGEDPVPFGRTKGDLERIAAIEAGRSEPILEHLATLEDALGPLRALLGGLRDQDWIRRGLHPTLGVMDLHRIVQDFLVGHLEAHADQLHELGAGPAGPPD
ncbi:MAG TPA: hypothetical protein DIT48_04320 [Actinobacteria bacterium]|jgi:hypothetical protein|nr:hypothetical protein [Actinomycetota bacterium]